LDQYEKLGGDGHLRNVVSVNTPDVTVAKGLSRDGKEESGLHCPHCEPWKWHSGIRKNRNTEIGT